MTPHLYYNEPTLQDNIEQIASSRQCMSGTKPSRDHTHPRSGVTVSEESIIARHYGKTMVASSTKLLVCSKGNGGI